MKANLGNFERIVRLALGVTALGVALVQEKFGLSELIVVVLGIFLIANGLFARCYLWKLLGWDSRARAGCELDNNPDN